jgi:hypothetical protein
VLCSVVDSFLTLSIVVGSRDTIVGPSEARLVITRGRHHSSHTGKHSEDKNSLHDQMFVEIGLTIVPSMCLLYTYHYTDYVFKSLLSTAPNNMSGQNWNVMARNSVLLILFH